MTAWPPFALATVSLSDATWAASADIFVLVGVVLLLERGVLIVERCELTVQIGHRRAVGDGARGIGRIGMEGQERGIVDAGDLIERAMQRDILRGEKTGARKRGKASDDDHRL